MGAGFKDFGSEVLRSVDVDDYLMKQTVMSFADATARDAAVTAPEEGMHAYLADSNVVTAYDGAAWRVVFRVVSTKGTLLVADGTEVAGLAPGTDTYVLTADSAQATGVKWATLPGGDNIQAKETAGAASSESVTWTSAFGSTPIVTVSPMNTASFNEYANVSSRSTTGATVVSRSGSGGTSVVKMVIAREPT